MNLSHSSSFSSTTTCTTTNASFDIYNTRKATTRCFAGVLRRIFCSRTLPTHPSDHTIEPNSASRDVKCDKGREHMTPEKMIDVTASPGIVARLMGLETLPIQVHQSPKSVSRSRSMNSVDELKKEADSRVHTTSSFREIPVYFEVENEEFLVLTFGKGSERRSREKRKGKSGTIGELKQKKREKSKTRGKLKEQDNKKNQGQGSNSKHSDSNANPDEIIEPGDQVQCGIAVQSEDVEESQDETGQLANNKVMNDLTNLSCCRKNMMKHDFSNKAVESECRSEESSPVSVLDFGTFISDPEISTDDSTLEVSNSTKEFQDQHETNEIEFTSPQNDDTLVEEDQEEESNTSEGKFVGSWKIDINDTRSRWSKTWTKICNISGSEMVQLNWVAPGGKWKLEDEDYEGIGVDFESQILDQLLDETLQLLVVDLPIQNLNL